MNTKIFASSEEFSEKLRKLIYFPLFEHSSRYSISALACSISVEHWESAIILCKAGSLTSAATVHRAQFEAVLRSVWAYYAATDSQIEKLACELTTEADLAAKAIPQMSDMMKSVKAHAPMEASDALARFRDNAWKALNSYAHAGLHPIRRHAEGYPVALLESITRNANGLAVVAYMQLAVICGVQPMQKNILELADKYPECMPARL